jgi:uncharacterized protein YjbI with pentapeptide repeats
VVSAALTLTAVVGVIVYGYLAKPGWIGVADKTFWDYLELLIVPAALAIGVYWLNRAQQERDREADQAQQQRERKADEDRRQRELEVGNQRAQDEALQAYLDHMSQLVADKERPLRRAQPGDSLSVLARARTLTVLPRLDGERKGSVLQFLYEAGLIDKTRVVVDLMEADLREANLTFANLMSAYLRRTDLIEAILFRAFLMGAGLERTDLSRANLSGALLGAARMEWADLRQANLSGADLRMAQLYYANLQEANMSGANLRGVLDDHDRVITNDDLAQQGASLQGATMPNGQKYEDWLKDKKAQGKDVKNE